MAVLHRFMISGYNIEELKKVIDLLLYVPIISRCLVSPLALLWTRWPALVNGTIIYPRLPR